MSQEFFTVTVFLTVSSLAWGQYAEMSRPEPNHCQLRPDRRRCGPTFLPRWYYNPVKGNCFLFKYGGCHGNRNNFLSQEECLEKCVPQPPPNAPPPGTGYGIQRRRTKPYEDHASNQYAKQAHGSNQYETYQPQQSEAVTAYLRPKQSSFPDNTQQSYSPDNAQQHSGNANQRPQQYPGAASSQFSEPERNLQPTQNVVQEGYNDNPNYNNPQEGRKHRRRRVINVKYYKKDPYEGKVPKGEGWVIEPIDGGFRAIKDERALNGWMHIYERAKVIHPSGNSGKTYWYFESIFDPPERVRHIRTRHSKDGAQTEDLTPSGSGYFSHIKFDFDHARKAWRDILPVLPTSDETLQEVIHRERAEKARRMRAYGSYYVEPTPKNQQHPNIASYNAKQGGRSTAPQNYYQNQNYNAANQYNTNHYVEPERASPNGYGQPNPNGYYSHNGRNNQGHQAAPSQQQYQAPNGNTHSPTQNQFIDVSRLVKELQDNKDDSSSYNVYSAESGTPWDHGHGKPQQNNYQTNNKYWPQQRGSYNDNGRTEFKTSPNVADQQHHQHEEEQLTYNPQNRKSDLSFNKESLLSNKKDNLQGKPGELWVLRVYGFGYTDDNGPLNDLLQFDIEQNIGDTSEKYKNYIDSYDKNAVNIALEDDSMSKMELENAIEELIEFVFEKSKKNEGSLATEESEKTLEALKDTFNDDSYKPRRRGSDRFRRKPFHLRELSTNQYGSRIGYISNGQYSRDAKGRPTGRVTYTNDRFVDRKPIRNRREYTDRKSIWELKHRNTGYDDVGRSDGRKHIPSEFYSGRPEEKPYDVMYVKKKIVTIEETIDGRKRRKTSDVTETKRIERTKTKYPTYLSYLPIPSEIKHRIGKRSVIRRNEVDEDMIEAYVERCKAPADTGPCRARLNKWYYDAGKRRCFPFIYGGCGGNSNKYDNENLCMLKCATSVDRMPPPYLRSGPPRGPPDFRERVLLGRPPLRRSIRNPDRRGAFFRTFFPLIWQVSIPKTKESEPQVSGSPKPENLEAMMTTGVAMSQDVTTPVKVEVTADTTTQPPKIKTTGVKSLLASTTPPTRLEEEELNGGNMNNNAILDEADTRDYEEEEPKEESENEDINEEDELEGNQSIEGESMESDDEEQRWKSNEGVENSSEEDREDERGDETEEEANSSKDTEVEYDAQEDVGRESEEENKDYDYGQSEEEKEEAEDSTESRSEENKVEDRSISNENEEDNEEANEEEIEEENKEENEDDKDEKLGAQRPRGPVIRFLFRSPNRYNRPSNRRAPRPMRPAPVRRLDYRKYYGPNDMSSRFENTRRFPSFNRQRGGRNWRDRNNRTPKRGITFTQVFVNKPPHPPVVSRHPLLPMPMNPYPVSPYHGPVLYRLPSLGYSKSFSMHGRQTPGMSPQFTGTFQSSRSFSVPDSRFRVQFVPRIGEPNMACIQPPAVYRCLFGIPSTTPFWYFDARLGKCSVFYFAGCGATLNRFNSKVECEDTCMVTSPRPEITTESRESVEQSAPTSTESVEITDDEMSTEVKTEVVSTTAPEIKPEFVKETEIRVGGNDESDNAVEGTIELSKTHKIHILHELTDKDKLLASEKSSDLEYVMVVGIVCLSGIALLILVSLGLMYMFKRFQIASSEKGFPRAKKETVIEAVLKSHLQGNGLPKIICPVPLGPPQNTSL